MKNSVKYFLLVAFAIGLFSCAERMVNKSPVSEKYASEEALSYDMSSNIYEKESLKKDVGGEDDFDDGIQYNTEEYDKIVENNFKNVKETPVSTFSIDVDNASYSNVRRFLNGNQLPPSGSVRIEEMINYFDYDYKNPSGVHPFAFETEVSDCAWNTNNKLIHIGIQGKKLDYNDIRPSNFVFLIDASGSMEDSNKLPLLKKSLLMLLEQLDDKDMISIVAYAGAAGLILPPTRATEKSKIKNALESLNAGGSTAGGEGIELAYKTAKDAYIPNGNNRVILATDGDFNVGTSSTASLVDLIIEKRKDDIYLTILGFGMGNYKDGRMEQISNSGNGNYFYIDNIKEAEKVFVREMRANMFTIAKDVKIQIEFNPAKVESYRLIGYENRVMNKEDFDDDKKDAGELGAGHSVTALYEIVPAGTSNGNNTSGDLKYQQNTVKTGAAADTELMTIKFRYKKPKEEVSILMEYPVIDNKISLANSSNNFKFSAAVAGFGMILTKSQFKGNLTFASVSELAKSGLGNDEFGYKTEFINMIRTAELLAK